MSNSIVASYNTHRAAIGTGGESGEWPDIAQAMARVILDRVGELPFDRPLRNVFATPLRRPNGDWPNLIIHHLRSTCVHADSCWRTWRHDAQLILICGPWGDDPQMMEAMGTAYIDPLVRVVDANQTMENMCTEVEIDPAGAQWQLVSYGPTTPFQSAPQWYALVVPVQVYAQSLRTWG